jgi:hypothetical protein
VANGESQETMTGLAKRWLKTQLTLHGDPVRSRREQQEAAEIEQRMRDKQREDATRSAVEALIPPSWKHKLSDWEQQAEDRREQQAAEARAEHAARPRAELVLELTGDIDGSLTAAVPVVVREPQGEERALIVEPEPFDQVVVSSHQFLGLQFAVPEYRGSGTYDLSAMAGDHWIDTWDPLWFQFWLDNLDESFFWSPDYGQATTAVDDTARTISISMPMRDAAGRAIRLDARLRLPTATP